MHTAFHITLLIHLSDAGLNRHRSLPNVNLVEVRAKALYLVCIDILSWRGGHVAGVRQYLERRDPFHKICGSAQGVKSVRYAGPSDHEAL